MSGTTSITPLRELEKKIQAESGGNVYNAKVDTHIKESTGNKSTCLIISIDPHNTSTSGRASLLRNIYREEENKKIWVSSTMPNKVVVRLHPDYKEGITQ